MSIALLTAELQETRDQLGYCRGARDLDEMYSKRHVHSLNAAIAVQAEEITAFKRQIYSLSNQRNAERLNAHTLKESSSQVELERDALALILTRMGYCITSLLQGAGVDCE